MNRQGLPEMSNEEALLIRRNFLESFPYVYKGFDKTVPEFTQTKQQTGYMLEAAQTTRLKRKEKRLVAGGFHNLPANNRVAPYTSTRGEQRRIQNGKS